MIPGIFKILGVQLMGYSVTMLPPIAVAFVKEPTQLLFLFSALATFFLGMLLWFPVRKNRREVKSREGFLIFTLAWITVSLVGTIPCFVASNSSYFSLAFLDALFETISGLTTTGATVLVGLDTMPRSLMYYRMQLHFIGGGGIILLGIAIMPMLGVGGIQLFRADIPGPFKKKN